MAAKNRLTSKTVALPACGERVRVRGTLKKLDSQRLPLTRRFAIAEASLRRSFLRTAAEGGLCSPRKRGEVR
jgi:hypothetical protein